MTVAQAQARVGVSGWVYPPWRGVFYPTGLRQADELAYASSHLTSIEVNGSFYSLQRPASWMRWRDATPPDFVFAVKGPRYITHLKRLADIDLALANFLASGVLALGPKLGPLLWQLPPNLRYDHDLLEGFLGRLPRTTGQARELARGREARMDGKEWLQIDEDRPLRHALEPRSPSFDDEAVAQQLTRHGVATVLGDNEGRWPRLDWTTADFAYARLHGDEVLYTSGYDDDALDRWNRWARAHLSAGRDVYIYFDNDAKVRAPIDAMGLIRRLRS
ncbi:MAG TPA: DUF72 domain-containing protein [Pseudolysinimonas sp.]|nr:DUF72 domain-containing protein [Pseudolysinimonas sp.]